MGDCISRQAVLDEINKVCFSRRRKWIEFRANNGSNGERDYIIKFIKNMSPVQPAQKEGKWIPHEVKLPDRTILNYTCSACGRKLIGYGTETLSEVPYCHCGAKMEEGGERRR